MRHRRLGNSLSEVLVALVLIALAASWALQAAASTERAVGAARGHTDALHRASLALAELHSLPCDSTTASRSSAEPRWHVIASRTNTPHERTDRVTLHTRRGDTITTTRHRWCSR